MMTTYTLTQKILFQVKRIFIPCFLLFMSEFFTLENSYSSNIEIEAEKAEVYQQEALYSFQAREYKSAIKLFTKAIKLNSELKRSYLGRALSYYFLGKYEKAADDFTQALEMDPYNILLRLNRAHTYMRLHDYQRASKDIRKALQIYPDFVKTRAQEIRMREELKNLAEEGEGGKLSMFDLTNIDDTIHELNDEPHLESQY